MEPIFDVGDKAYYPVYGVAEVAAIEEQTIDGRPTPVYILTILDSGLKIIVPTANVTTVGLREIISMTEVKEVYSILRSREPVSDNQTWNRRSREYMEKIKTGSAFEIAEVLRDLCLLRTNKDLSSGERRMLDTAQNLLVQEIALAQKTPKGDVVEEIELIFENAAA